MRKTDNDHLIERVGAKLRAMMPWSEEGKARAAKTAGDRPAAAPEATKAAARR